MDMKDVDEWALARSGDGEAFGRLYDKHYARVLRHSQRLVPVPTDAEDVVSVTFLEVWRKREGVRFVDGSLLPWLLVVATYSAKNLSRSTRRHEALLRKLPRIRPDGAWASADELSDIEVALSQLRLADRQVITLRVLEGFTARETATALNVPEGTVKSRLSRAKRKLALELSSVSGAPVEKEWTLL